MFLAVLVIDNLGRVRLQALSYVVGGIAAGLLGFNLPAAALLGVGMLGRLSTMAGVVSVTVAYIVYWYHVKYIRNSRRVYTFLLVIRSRTIKMGKLIMFVSILLRRQPGLPPRSCTLPATEPPPMQPAGVSPEWGGFLHHCL